MNPQHLNAQSSEMLTGRDSVITSVKHFPFKMLNDVGMEVPKGVETRKQLCSKAGMMACNSNNMRR